ncbi:MAG: oligosaccharide flippase family protein [Chlamydiales bacterium]|nr:oligosaccharide flippase family protein [Chlamydiales bacterium]
MLRKSLVANFLGKGWQAGVQLLIIPLYAKLMGAEAYGLVGLFGLLTTLSCLFDTGLSSFLNRQLSRYRALEAPPESFRNLMRTIEIVYWTSCMAVGGAILFFAPQITVGWLNVKVLDTAIVERSIALMGVSFAFQLPALLYQNAMQGLQKQTLMNLSFAAFVTIRAMGALSLLFFVSPSPVLFFIWQAGSGISYSLFMRYLLWREMPKSEERTFFDKRYLSEGGKFAGGMTIMTILEVLLMHLDKIMLSKILPLETFGYYSIAAALASGLIVVVNPIFSTSFPLFSYVVAQKDEERVSQLYHKTTQIMAIFVLPLAMLLSFFSFEILLVWTGSHEIAKSARWPLTFLAIGSGINGILHMPYALQLAHGWIKIALYQNGFFFIVSCLLLPYMISRWGMAGASATWSLVNLSMVCMTSYFLHRRYLVTERARWLVQDILLPGAACFSVLLIGKWFFYSTEDRLLLLLNLILLTGITFIVAILSASFPRNWALQKLRLRKINL